MENLINPNSILLQKMTFRELTQIEDILFTDFDDFWTISTFRKELENPFSCFFVAKVKNEIIGFAGFRIILEDADLMNIVIKKSYRNQGIGLLLLKELIQQASFLSLNSLTLEVHEENIPAQLLYEKCGFKKIGLRKNYYKNGKNALLMTKKIEG